MLIKVNKYKSLKVEENVDLTCGPGCCFNGMIIHNDGHAKTKTRSAVTIGKNLHSGKNCLIRTSDHSYKNGYPIIHGDLSGYDSANVKIGDHVWLGDNVTIMKGSVIGNGCIIQANSTVIGTIPDLAIAGGHPCRPFAFRDAEEYELLKSFNLSKKVTSIGGESEESRNYVRNVSEYFSYIRKKFSQKG